MTSFALTPSERCLWIYTFPVCHESHPSSSSRVPRCQVGLSRPPHPLWSEIRERFDNQLSKDLSIETVIKSKPEEEFWQNKTRLIVNWSGVDGNYQLLSASKIRNKRNIWQSTVKGLVDRNREKNRNQKKSFEIRRLGWLRIDQGSMGAINWWAPVKFEIRGRFENQLSKDWLSGTVRKIETTDAIGTMRKIETTDALI